MKKEANDVRVSKHAASAVDFLGQAELLSEAPARELSFRMYQRCRAGDDESDAYFERKDTTVCSEPCCSVAPHPNQVRAEFHHRGDMLKILYALRGPVSEIFSLLSGHRVEILSGERSLRENLFKKHYDLILLEDGIDAMQVVKTEDPRAEVILFSTEEINSVEALKKGAFACFALPFQEPERLREIIGVLSEMVRIRVETAYLEKQLTLKYTFSGVVGRNPQMLNIFDLLRRIAPYYRMLTIIGETGTGKEALARALHMISPVANQPFVAVNCGALSDNLIHSELFGHKKGSFTGAVSDKIGLFEAAGEGTIFLDEIGELPLSVQPHLLRVLQDGEFRPIGSTRSLRAKCRVIAATHQDLDELVRKGRFREDLFYRLTPLTVTVPPLRERKDDLPLLCRHFLERFNGRTGKKMLGISRPAQSALFAFSWPGNVRMLENAIEHAALLATESYIRIEDLPSYIVAGDSNGREDTTAISLEAVIKNHVEKILHACNGNRSRAAEKLNISRNALLRKLKKYAIH